MRADRFKYGDDVQLPRIAGDAAGQDGAAINEHCRPIQPRNGDERAGHIFVASSNSDEAIHAFAADNSFDGVGNDLARDEGIFHSLGSH